MAESQAQFARRKGWDRSTVTRLKQQGKLVMTAEGLVDIEKSEALLASLMDPRKEGVRQRHARDRRQREGEQRENGQDSPATKPDPNDSVYQLLTKHRAAAEENRAELLRLELEEKEGRLVDAEAVRRLAFAAGRAGREKYLNVAARIQAQFPDLPAGVHEFIATLHREAAEELARTLAQELVPTGGA